MVGSPLLSLPLNAPVRLKPLAATQLAETALLAPTVTPEVPYSIEPRMSPLDPEYWMKQHSEQIRREHALAQARVAEHDGHAGGQEIGTTQKL